MNPNPYSMPNFYMENRPSTPDDVIVNSSGTSLPTPTDSTLEQSFNSITFRHDPLMSSVSSRNLQGANKHRKSPHSISRVSMRNNGSGKIPQNYDRKRMEDSVQCLSPPSQCINDPNLVFPVNSPNLNIDNIFSCETGIPFSPSDKFVTPARTMEPQSPTRWPTYKCPHSGRCIVCNIDETYFDFSKNESVMKNFMIYLNKIYAEKAHKGLVSFASSSTGPKPSTSASSRTGNIKKI